MLVPLRVHARVLRSKFFWILRRFSPQKTLFEADPDFRVPFTREEIAVAEAIQTLCLPWGPYRNLTTITAAFYALHPQAFVLNHGGVRIFSDPSLDFFAGSDPERWRKFSLAATRMAQHGSAGSHGGNLLHAHAFHDPALMSAYQERFGAKVLPDEPRTLFWKESMHITKHLRKSDPDFSNIRQMPVRVRFILPVRSPLDCTMSNMKTGLYAQFSTTPQFSKLGVLNKLVDFYVYANQQVERFPELFFLLSELDLSTAMLQRLAGFSGLDYDQRWSSTILQVVKFDRHYDHSPEEWAYYEKLVRNKLGTDSPLGKVLLSFCN